MVLSNYQKQERFSQYDLSDKCLSIEVIDNKMLLNLWVVTSHLEQIEGVEKPVFVSDIGFEVMLPVEPVGGNYKAALGITI